MKPKRSGPRYEMRTRESADMLGEQKAILERLEATKRFGLVADYFVSWSGRRDRLVPKVLVWSNGNAADEVVQNYVAQLLRGLVPVQRIAVGE
jgi:hypothetical protein